MLKRNLFFLVLFFLSVSLLAQEKTKKVYRPDIPGTFLIDFGFNSGIGKPQFFNQGAWGSRTLNFYYHYPVRIGETKFTFNPGGGFSFERFKFTNNYTLLPQPGTDGSYVLDNPGSVTNGLGAPGISFLQNASIKKSMLVANYFDLMPIEFRFDTNPKDHSRGFNISVGGRVGFLIESHTKIKYSANGVNAIYKDKQQHGLNPIRYGVYTRFGFGNFNWFFQYNLSPYFATNKGPINSSSDASHTTMNTMTFGISVNGF
jgi:hypothetical protein